MSGVIVILNGYPGVGKTSVARELAYVLSYVRPDIMPGCFLHLQLDLQRSRCGCIWRKRTGMESRLTNQDATAQCTHCPAEPARAGRCVCPSWQCAGVRRASQQLGTYTASAGSS